MALQAAQRHLDRACFALDSYFMAEFNDHAAANAYRTLGTPMLVKLTNTAGAFPNRYWTKGTMDNWENISAEALIEKMVTLPARILGLTAGLSPGNPADLTIVDPDTEYTVDADKFKSKSRNTPFNGWKVKGKAVVTIVGGRVVYDG